MYLGPARDPQSLNPPNLRIRQGAKTNAFLPPSPTAARLGAWIRDFADKVPSPGDLAAPQPAAVETGPEASAEKQLPARIPTRAPGKVSKLGGGVSQERKQPPACPCGRTPSVPCRGLRGRRQVAGEGKPSPLISLASFPSRCAACIRLLSVLGYFGPMRDLMCLPLFLSVFFLAYLFPRNPSPCPVLQREVPAASLP